MDDLSTIFYIIVAIIYVIYSAIKRGKPKNLPQSGQEPPVPQDFGDVTQNPPPQKNQRRPTFEDLLREFTQQEPVEEKEVYEEEIDRPSSFEPSQQPFAEEKKPASVYEKYQNVEVGEDDVLRAPSVFKAVNEEYEETTSSSVLGTEIREMLKNPDGLKKTILLNEIIRPKYF